MSEPEKVEYLAYLPPIQSAIKVSGEGDTMRIQLEIPVNITPDAFRIALFTGKRLKVTIEEMADQIEETLNGKSRKHYSVYAKKTND